MPEETPTNPSEEPGETSTGGEQPSAPDTLAAALARVVVDPAVNHHEIDGFRFPLGCYPTEEMVPVPGYTVTFEAADGSDPAADFAGPTMGEELEEWPDRYVFDILITHDRLRPLCRALFALMPGRFFPILDILGNDAFREIDPYIAYELVGIERFYDALRTFDAYFFEDGLAGFGAMSLEPFFYIFVDEHKIVTVRTLPEQRDRVERLLAAFDLTPVEEIKGPDSAAHEHRGVLITPDERPDALTPDEVIERLRDAWDLQLNIDATTNLDADGTELGITAWQCIVRCAPEDENIPDFYAELLLTAPNLEQAEAVAEQAVAPRTPSGGGPVIAADWDEVDVIRADRVTFEQLDEWVGKDKPYKRDEAGLVDLRWLTGDPFSSTGKGARK
jgi:hypothetical protein